MSDESREEIEDLDQDEQSQEPFPNDSVSAPSQRAASDIPEDLYVVQTAQNNYHDFDARRLRYECQQQGLSIQGLSMKSDQENLCAVLEQCDSLAEQIHS